MHSYIKDFKIANILHMREYLLLIISNIRKYRYKNNRCKK